MAGPTSEPGVIDDEELEWRLIAPHLLAAPEAGRNLSEGGRLADRQRRLQAWLTMEMGATWTVGTASPPTCWNQVVYLPDALPPPVQDDNDDAAYRVMALFQAHLFDLDCFTNRAWVRELHNDWVLHVSSHLLMSHAIVGKWNRDDLGIVSDLQRVQADHRLTQLWCGRQRVRVADQHPIVARILQGLVPIHAEPAPWIDDILGSLSSTPKESMPVVLPGLAQRLRQGLRKHRLGAPPLPYWVGVAHPAWFLETPNQDKRRANAWKRGPRPLQALLRARRSKSMSTNMRPTQRFESAPIVQPQTTELRYAEWDVEANAYRQAAARIIEEDASFGPADAVEKITQLHRVRLQAIRREFQRLKLDRRWLHGQHDGPELDYSRMVRACVDQHAGVEPDRNLYVRLQQAREPLTVLTLVDLSGSTKGDVLPEQQKAIVFFAEALGALGVPHAFFGFRSEGAQSCRFLRIQMWNDDSSDVAKRMGSLTAKGGSRLGVFIRHASTLLAQRPEGHRLLLILSDGRPEDRDGYRGVYGLADSAMAVREALSSGIFVHCLSLDVRSSNYLPRVFGPHGYTTVARANDLPEVLPAVFRSVSWG